VISTALLELPALAFARSRDARSELASSTSFSFRGELAWMNGDSNTSRATTTFALVAAPAGVVLFLRGVTLNGFGSGSATGPTYPSFFFLGVVNSAARFCGVMGAACGRVLFSGDSSTANVGGGGRRRAGGVGVAGPPYVAVSLRGVLVFVDTLASVDDDEGGGADLDDEVDDLPFAWDFESLRYSAYSSARG